MTTTTMPKLAKDYFIIGPAMQPHNGVLEAVYSLLYLPPNYKLMLPSIMPENTTFRNEVDTAIQKNALHGRVHFINQDDTAGSPEAFASAALQMSRTAY